MVSILDCWNSSDLERKKIIQPIKIIVDNITIVFQFYCFNSISIKISYKYNNKRMRIVKRYKVISKKQSIISNLVVVTIMKYFIIFSFVIVNIPVYCQNDKTIYEFGKPVTSCESNFENLFRNWGSSYVTNYTDIELLSYEYVEILSDTSRINYYADLFTALDAFSPIVSKSSSNSVETVELTVETIKQYMDAIDAIPDSDKKEQYKKEIENRLALFKNTFKNTVQVEDKVYLIKMKIKGIYTENHVFCSAKGNKIIWDRLFLNLVRLKKS
jgi:hypothetical protein